MELLSRLKMLDAWVSIPAGEFLMGSQSGEPNRFGVVERQHLINVSTFQMLRTPVTFAMFDIYSEAAGKEKPKDEGWGRDDRPVINVTYWDAVDYAVWLSEQIGWHCRLPTEAEWEYACRAGTTTPFWTGESITPEQANFDGNAADWLYEGGQTTPVGRYSVNPWGLHDMHGNVWEWCASVYDTGYTGLETRDASREKKNGNPRVLRGGDWHSEAASLRSASRFGNSPERRFLTWGFRLVRY